MSNVTIATRGKTIVPLYNAGRGCQVQRQASLVLGNVQLRFVQRTGLPCSSRASPKSASDPGLVFCNFVCKFLEVLFEGEHAGVVEKFSGSAEVTQGHCVVRLVMTTQLSIGFPLDQLISRSMAVL